ncbi:hypothetical protein FB45DRAFT_893564 [Roridomyces roridus]|uniref:Uncharacterized protein n=1 Tax=Roridomyces roridus TaxID=1738132 RepID=A0AAD7CFJ1_9AGAR|nr:hypothetical protein FB45DRAFT_893564 [Roridomyces roridus]
MSRPLATLPSPLLDEIVANTLLLAPSLRIVFLCNLGRLLHASAVRVIFDTLSLSDEAAQSSGAAFTVLDNPSRYASSVKTLLVSDPTLPSGASLGEPLRPLDADLLYRILHVCTDIEALKWSSSFPPPDGLCEVLAKYNPRLGRVAFGPSSLSPSRSTLAKWDAPSLPLLTGHPLTCLHICRLSQAGARAFSAFLNKLGEESVLECLNIDFIWLDDSLCEKIVGAGRKTLQKLTLSTSGTKLTDKGIVSILEGCDALEELVLDEVQGRLSRTLWTKPAFPSGFKALRVVVAERGPHHSWAADHLDSLHAIPLGSLSSLDIVRREAPPSLHCGVAMYDSTVDDTVALKQLPPAFMDALKEQKSQMTSFRCDFWSWSVTDIKVLLECCPKLKCAQLCLDMSFPKLIGLTSTFASLPNLHTLSVSVTPGHAPGKPPSPILPAFAAAPASLPTPTDSPVLKSKSVLLQLLDFDQMQTQTSHSETAGDPSMPLLRDIKRFVRKCPQLQVIDWYGKNGRGSWIVSRGATSSKIGLNVSVEYTPPRITEEVLRVIEREQAVQDALKGWSGFAEIERSGHAWTGETAEAFAAERLAEKEREEPPSPVERLGKTREAGKRVRLPSVSVSSSSGSSDIPLPLTPTASPTQHHTPITPPLSDYSTSEADAAWQRHCPPSPSHRKRAPSEPSTRNPGNATPRTRSATTSSSKDSAGERGGAARGGKSSRGRGGASTRGARRAAGSNAESGRGRGGKTRSEMRRKSTTTTV